MKPAKLLIVFGTRPEAIKIAPLVFALKDSPRFEVVTCTTAQHRGLLDQTLAFFGIRPDHDLNLMREGQDLIDITSDCLLRLREIYRQVKPDMVLVQGDTATAMAASLAAFFMRIPIGHIEAGLRTGNKFSPYPEEANRMIITRIGDLHFAATKTSAANLKRENVPNADIHITGNTGVDALQWAKTRAQPVRSIESIVGKKKIILLTMHRRENFGEPMRNILTAVERFLERREEFHLLFPLHPNPNVNKTARDFFENSPRATLVEPLNYGEMVYALSQSYFVITDSGGLQEEAPALAKPVLVPRDATERPEAIAAGCARLVGTDTARILAEMEALAKPNSLRYRAMVKKVSPFGKGGAALLIRNALEKRFFPGEVHRPRKTRRAR